MVNQSPKSASLGRALAAELLGTTILTAVVSVVVVGVGAFQPYQYLYAPLLIGIVLGFLVYIFGSLSGGHFNPLVSISLAVIGKLSITKLFAYLIIQVMGAYCGLYFAKQMIGSLPDAPTRISGSPFLGEFLGGFILVAGVMAVVVQAVDKRLGGLVIGAALAIGLSLTLEASGGIVNPAIALVVKAYSTSYILAPVLGGVAAAVLFNLLYKPTHNA